LEGQNMVIRMVIRMVSRMVIRMVSRMVILWLYGVLEGPHYAIRSFVGAEGPFSLGTGA